MTLYKSTGVARWLLAVCALPACGEERSYTELSELGNGSSRWPPGSALEHPEDFEFDPDTVYVVGQFNDPDSEIDGKYFVSPALDPDLYILGTESTIAPHFDTFAMMGNDVVFVAQQTNSILRSVPDFVGPLSDLTEYPPDTNANDALLTQPDCEVLQILRSPDGRMIYRCGADWFEDGRKVYHGHLDFLGYDGWAIKVHTSPAYGGDRSEPKYNYPDPVSELHRVVNIDRPEVVAFGSEFSTSSTLAVRARPNGIFNIVTGGGARIELWTLDAEGHEGPARGFHLSFSVLHQPGRIVAAALTAEDELFIAYQHEETNRYSTWHCGVDEEDCSILERERNPRFNERSEVDQLLGMIRAGGSENEKPYVVPPAQDTSVPPLRDGQPTYLTDEVYIAGHIVNPGHDNDGKPAAALFATPQRYIMGFEEAPLAMRMGLPVLGAEAFTLCYENSAGEFLTLVPEHVGRLPTDDLDYYPTHPAEDDVPLPYAALECLRPRLANSCAVVCGDEEYYDDSTRLAVGSPPTRNSPGAPAILTRADDTGETEFIGEIMPGPVVAGRSDTGDAPGEDPDAPDGIHMIVRVQDPETFELTNEWELWTFIGDTHKRAGTYTVPDEYLALPLTRPDVAAITPNDDLYLAFRDETPEDDPDRKGDYIVRVDLDGNVQVSRTGNLAVDFLFTGP